MADVHGEADRLLIVILGAPHDARVDDFGITDATIWRAMQAA